jgi:hypothetical protein
MTPLTFCGFPEKSINVFAIRVNSIYWIKTIARIGVSIEELLFRVGTNPLAYLRIIIPSPN